MKSAARTLRPILVDTCVNALSDADFGLVSGSPVFATIAGSSVGYVLQGI
jgi:hypothetical protein